MPWLFRIVGAMVLKRILPVVGRALSRLFGRVSALLFKPKTVRTAVAAAPKAKIVRRAAAAAVPRAS